MPPKSYNYYGYATSDTRISNQSSTYDDFNATELYCPNCQQATPVKKKLLLILPEGDKYEYLCSFCGTSVGSKTEKNKRINTFI